MIGIDTSPLLTINRVVVTGELGCDISLGYGLNIIKAEIIDDETSTNDCGKTTFTELIKYGLGARKRFDDGELSKKISQLFLEISLNGTVLTIHRSLTKPGARLSIFNSAYHPNLSYEAPAHEVTPSTEYSNYLLDKLGIPKVEVPQSSNAGANIIPITFQQFMRILYMEQRISFSEIMNKVQPEWLKTKQIEILLGMSSAEVEALTLEIQKLTDKIAKLEQEIEYISEFLTHSNEGNRFDVNEKKQNLSQKQADLSVQIKYLKQQMRGEDGITDQLRQQLDDVNTELLPLKENRDKMYFKIQDFKALKNSLHVDRDKIRKTNQANYVLSSVDFVTCPRCLQHITTEMKQRETNSQCMLCSRPMIVKASTTHIMGKSEIVDEEILEVDILLKKYQSNLKQVEEKIIQLTTTKTKLQADLDEQSQAYVSPFVDALEAVLQQQNQMEAQLELFEQQLKQWELLAEKEQTLSHLRKERQQLEIKKAAIQPEDDTKIKKLSEYYESFLRRVEYQNLKTARINPNSLMPLVNGSPYTADTGSGLLSVKIIAYHYILLNFSLDYPCYYPRFLMIDSPNAYDLNSDTYKKLLLQFHHLQEKYSPKNFQLILTTRDLPPVMEQYVIERLNNKNRMLLRLDGEREQSSLPLYPLVE